MRRTFVLAFIFTMLTSSAFAATHGMGFGVQGGLNIADASFSQEIPPSLAGTFSQTTDSRTGWSAGLFAEHKYTDMLFSQVELNYVQKGATIKTTATGSTTSATAELSLGYLELPILAKAKLDMGAIKPFGFIGPQVGYRLSVEQSTKTSAGATAVKTEPKGSFKPWELAVTAGIGAEYEVVKGWSALLSGRYVFGLTDMINDNAGEKADWKTRDIRILAGVKMDM